jgi:S1-C subfamily serine protease
MSRAVEALAAVRKRVCANDFGVPEWGDGKVGGKAYGVVARIVKDGSIVDKAGVQRSMAAISVDGTAVKTEAALMALFHEGVTISFIAKPDLPQGLYQRCYSKRTIK